MNQLISRQPRFRHRASIKPRPVWNNRDVLLCLPAEATTAWDDQVSNCALSLDTDHAKFYQTTRASVKMTHTAGASHMSMRSDAFAAKDLTNASVMTWLYMHEGTGAAALTGLGVVTVFLYDSAGQQAWKNIYNIANADANDGGAAGWMGIPWCVTDMTFEPDFDITKVVKVKVAINVDDTATTAAVSLGGIMFVDAVGQPAWMLRIDNTAPELLDICAYAASKGVRVSAAISPDFVGTGGYLTADQLRMLEREGHFVCLYTGTADSTQWVNMTRGQKAAILDSGRVRFDRWDLDPMGARCACMSGNSQQAAWDWDNVIGPQTAVMCASMMGDNFASAASRSNTGVFSAPWKIMSATFTGGVDPSAWLSAYLDAAVATGSVFCASSHIYSAGERTIVKSLIDTMSARADMINVTLGDVGAGLVGRA